MFSFHATATGEGRIYRILSLHCGNNTGQSLKFFSYQFYKSLFDKPIILLIDEAKVQVPITTAKMFNIATYGILLSDFMSMKEIKCQYIAVYDCSGFLLQVLKIL